MCLVCIDMAKGHLTAFKAKQNLNEMILGKELEDSLMLHVEEVLEKIETLELLEHARSM